MFQSTSPLIQTRATMAKAAYHKHFIPLESNPELFAQLAHQLGASKSISFDDVFSLDEPSILACVRRPVHAMILTFPTTPLYEEDKQVEEEQFMKAKSLEALPGDILWFKQTINNACGLYGLLHGICSSAARRSVESGSFLHNLITKSPSLSESDRALLLEESKHLEEAYAHVAIQGDSAVPESAEDEVDYHYICFVRSAENGHVYELDGDRLGPVDRGAILAKGDDMLGEGMLAHIKTFMKRYEHENMSFNLMSLVEN